MRTAFVALCLVSTAACIGYERTSTVGPSATGVAALLGTWSSSTAAPSLPTPGACSNFKWSVTEQTGNNASGTFSATCAGGLNVAGTASGSLAGSTIAWNAQAAASVPGLPACPITLTGTAELGVDSIRVPYSGDTCVGRVSGVEVMRKN
jgi:hypothetical protein